MTDGRPGDAARDVNGQVGDAGPRVMDGRYRLDRILGSGGMGTVWRGLDLRLERPVAVKVLSGGGLSLPKAMERFGREARAVARLSHPNIVPVYDFGTHVGDPYLVMELVDGMTVADLLDDGPVLIADVVAISAQICDGLDAAHAAGIIHRDVKPSNLIVTATGVLRICDFGVARLLEGADHADLTGSAVAMGSPKYMAPEQINGDPVDGRTDLYGLGCSMYAMLTGRPPFSTGTALSVAHQQMTVVPPPVTVHRADTPPGLAALVSDLLAKAPAARPPDAATVKARIVAAADGLAGAVPPGVVGTAAWLPGRSVTGSPPLPDVVTPPTQGPRPTRRWAVGAIAAVLAAGAVAAALIVTTPAGNQSAARRLAVTAEVTHPDAVSSTAPASQNAPINGGAVNSPTAAPAPIPSPTPAPSPPVDPMFSLRQSIQRQADTGGLKPDAVKDLDHAVDDLDKSMSSANPDDETKKLKALRDKLTTLYRGGKLTSAGYAEINDRVDAVAAKIGPG